MERFIVTIRFCATERCLDGKRKVESVVYSKRDARDLFRIISLATQWRGRRTANSISTWCSTVSRASLGGKDGRWGDRRWAGGTWLKVLRGVQVLNLVDDLGGAVEVCSPLGF